MKYLQRTVAWHLRQAIDILGRSTGQHAHAQSIDYELMVTRLWLPRQRMKISAASIKTIAASGIVSAALGIYPSIWPNCPSSSIIFPAVQARTTQAASSNQGRC